VYVPFRFRRRTRPCGFAGSGRTSSVSLTPRGTVSSIRLKSAEQVFLKKAFDAASLHTNLQCGCCARNTMNRPFHRDVTVGTEDSCVRYHGHIGAYHKRIDALARDVVGGTESDLSAEKRRTGRTYILLSKTVKVVSKPWLPDLLSSVPGSTTMVGKNSCWTPPKEWPHATSCSPGSAWVCGTEDAYLTWIISFDEKPIRTKSAVCCFKGSSGLGTPVGPACVASMRPPRKGM
jgi:hypothetical protein